MAIASRTSLVAQTVKSLPTMRETWVQSLGREDPLEKEMATHSSVLAWKIPWMEEPGRLQSMGSQRVGHDGATSLSLSIARRGNSKCKGPGAGVCLMCQGLQASQCSRSRVRTRRGGRHEVGRLIWQRGRSGAMVQILVN